MKESISKKIGGLWRLVDLTVRNVSAGGISNGRLKCILGFNHCGVRENFLNVNKTGQYPRFVAI